jgi:hypothetical protein
MTGIARRARNRVATGSRIVNGRGLSRRRPWADDPSSMTAEPRAMDAALTPTGSWQRASAYAQRASACWKPAYACKWKANSCEQRANIRDHPWRETLDGRRMTGPARRPKHGATVHLGPREDFRVMLSPADK